MSDKTQTSSESGLSTLLEQTVRESVATYFRPLSVLLSAMTATSTLTATAVVKSPQDESAGKTSLSER